MMRAALRCFALTVTLLGAAPDGRFDGTWDTVLSCENAGSAIGYSFKFPSVEPANVSKAARVRSPLPKKPCRPSIRADVSIGGGQPQQPKADTEPRL